MICKKDLTESGFEFCNKQYAIFFRLVVILCLVSSSSFSRAVEDSVDKTKVSDYFQNQLYAEAIQYLESKHAETSTDLSLINSLGYAYFMNRKYSTAEKHYSHVLHIDSLNFTANRYMALIRKNYKDYQGSLRYYIRLLSIQPSNALLNKFCGDAYSVNIQPDSALRYYEKAYRLQSQNTDMVYPYANLLLEKDSYAKVDSVLKAFLDTDSANVSIMSLAINSGVEQQKWASAAAFTNRWLLSGEVDPAIATKLAKANYYLKNYKLSYKVCDTLISQGYELKSLLYYASQAMYKLNNYTKSSELLRRCLDISISKNSDLYYSSLADNFESQNKFQKAIAAYDTAYYLFKNELALYNIGRLYEKGLNNMPRALQFYRKYMLVAKPRNEEEKVYKYVEEVLSPRNASRK